jgi:DUF438 domain-containing protein
VQEGLSLSELINNREQRKKVLREIITDLHEGKPLAAVKARFDGVVKDLAPGELSAVEQSLIDEGLPITEVQRLCDVHSAVFRDALEKSPDMPVIPGHPVHTFQQENRALEKLINSEIKPLLSELRRASADKQKAIALSITEKLNLLWDIDKHYSRKENLLFPYLEKYGITAPPQVMWGVDDEIRAQLKETKKLAAAYQPDLQGDLISKAEDALERINEMIFKEEKILLPMALETLAEDEWQQVLMDSDEVGYCLIEPDTGWKPAKSSADSVGMHTESGRGSSIKMNTGVLSINELELIFSHLPVDLTFVDKNDTVKFFSATKDRIFPRTRTIIGRKVENCHPPASVHIVDQLVADFKSGKKDQEDFWIRMGEKYVSIRYFAIRDTRGDYQGTLEVTQDIAALQKITGEKRIAD